jgi:hypothetical protein
MSDEALAVQKFGKRFSWRSGVNERHRFSKEIGPWELEMHLRPDEDELSNDYDTRQQAFWKGLVREWVWSVEVRYRIGYMNYAIGVQGTYSGKRAAAKHCAEGEIDDLTRRLTVWVGEMFDV